MERNFYETNASAVPEDYRGLFHFAPPTGWMNDPNGFSWFQGQLHLFYQHNPYSAVPGPMHWGHAVSRDFLHWDNLPIVLTPDQPYDQGGCFSGTAFEEEGRHFLLYTGHLDPDPVSGRERQETQCLAEGDGLRYNKDSLNPVIDHRHLPPDASRGDFRDPKFWKENGTWYCLAVNADLKGDGRVLLFRAQDLRSWEYVGVATASQGRWGGMWECPDLFQVGGHEVLLWSAIGVPTQPARFQNSHSVLWSHGSLDRSLGVFTGSEPTEIDYGPDFYAPQTVRVPDGRILMIAWMQMWGRSIPTDDLGLGWAGQMTLPRELTWKDGCLIQLPLRELESRRGGAMEIEASVEGVFPLAGVVGRHLDLELVFREWTSWFALSLLRSKDGSEETLLSFDPGSGHMTLDRSRGGHRIVSRSEAYPEVNRYSAQVGVPRGELKLRIIIDRSSVEIFAQDGAVAMTATVFPRKEGDRVAMIVPGGSVQVRGRVWSLAQTEGAFHGN